MSIQNALASLAVSDLDTAITWYATLLGRPADSRPMPEVAEWKFPRGGWLQVYALAERAGKGSVTLAVDDVAAESSKLMALGIDVDAPPSSAKVRTVMIKDPDGNSIAFAETTDPTMAR